MNLLRPFRLCSVLAMVLLVCNVQATPLTQVDLEYTGFASGGSVAGRIRSDEYRRRVLAGLFQFDVSNPVGVAPWDWGDELEAFCVQIGINLDHSQTTYTLVEAIDYFGDADQVDMIGRLYTGFRDEVVDGATGAGFQLALWELVEETTESLSLTGRGRGSFRAGSFRGSRNLANGWLDSLADVTSEFDLYVLEAEGTQDLLVFSAAVPREIPLPASLGLLSLGLVMLRVRTQRQ